MSNKNNIDKSVLMAIEVLSETFSPVSKFSDAARCYTSIQVAEAIKDLTGQLISTEIVYQVMSDLGYTYVIDETSTTVKYVWLLKYKI